MRVVEKREDLSDLKKSNLVTFCGKGIDKNSMCVFIWVIAVGGLNSVGF